MTAREKLAGMFPSRSLGESVADEILAAHRAEVLTEEAAELKTHCLEHNRFAATGFADCPCRVADELLRRAGVAGRGE